MEAAGIKKLRGRYKLHLMFQVGVDVIGSVVWSATIDYPGHWIGRQWPWKIRVDFSFLDNAGPVGI
jgi:hypothetical protein